MEGKPGPGPEVVVGTAVIDEGDPAERHGVVDGVTEGDDRCHLLPSELGEAQVSIEARVQHRLAAQNFVAAGAADQHEADGGGGIVVEVTQVLEALPIEPLRLVDDDHPMGEIVDHASRSLAVPLGHPAFGSAIGGKPSEKEPSAGDVRLDRRLPETLAADGAFELGEPCLQLSDGQGLAAGRRGICHAGKSRFRRRGGSRIVRVGGAVGW